MLRDNTERPEAVAAGVARLIGTDRDAIVTATLTLLDDERAWSGMSKAVSPFGDGFAAERIAGIIDRHREMISRYRSEPTPAAKVMPR